MTRIKAKVSAVFMLDSDNPSVFGRYVALIRRGFILALCQVVPVVNGTIGMSSMQSVTSAVIIG